MKGKILMFIFGVLVGAIVTTSVFLIYDKNNSNVNTQSNDTQVMQMRDDQTPPERPDGEKPNGEKSQNDDGTPPELPSNNKTSNTDKSKAESK